MEFSIEIPKAKFDNHLAVPENDRIIFSAPFGSGKTYFLNKYFEDNENYNVIHLFPVNYSVASNKDIFELIKYDILFELLGKDVDFDQLNISHVEMLMKFSAKNAHHILAPFLMMIPEVGKSMYSIYEKLQGLGEKYFEEYDNANIDDKSKVEDYLGAFTESQGSIYEEDFYTQLICQLVDQLKVELDGGKQRETVLILDDLDRIDPEHIFRILNVLSAHLDQNESGNKFSFDRIILVFDQENVQRIFQNRYGSDVDYSGYIDKFYSHKVFRFVNHDSLSDKIKDLLRTIQRPDNNEYLDIHTDSSLFTQNIYYLLKSLIQSNQLTIRRLTKIIDKPFQRVSYTPQIAGNSLYRNGHLEIFYVIEFLAHIYGSLDECKEAIDQCNEFVDSEVDIEMRKRFISFALVLLDAPRHQFNPSLTGQVLKHFGSNQSIEYRTQNWHADHMSFLCNVQNIEFADEPSGRPVVDIQYFQILSATIDFAIEKHLIRTPH